jgi:membrane fusion protein (multidrug efflux system)
MSQSVMTASVRPILPTSAGERIADRPVSLAEQPPSARGDQASAAARDLSVPVIKTGKRPRLKLWAPVLACGFIAAAAYVYVPHLYVAETDDAFVQADTVAVVPKVAAYVSALRVTDNSTFSAGQLLVELDPRDFEVALDSATADLHSAEAARRSAEDQLREQGATTAAAQAQIDGDRATLGFATQQLARYGDLARTGFGTTQRFQQAQSDSGERTAALRHDLNALEAAKAHEVLLQTQINQADAAIAHAQAAVAQARLNLSYTKIYAPSAGSVANRSVQVGNFVQPGQTLLSAVPD